MKTPIAYRAYSETKNNAPDQTPRGFTLSELVVVIAAVAILAALVLPAMAAMPPRSKAFQCLNNMRQLALAWSVYSGEYNERLVLNSDPHVTGTYLFAAAPSWATGSEDWTTSQQNTNTAYLSDNRFSLLANFLDNSPSVFLCPADNYVSPVQRMIGWSHRARSVAMNAAVGDGNKYEQPGGPFGWPVWYNAKKSTDFGTPAPANTFVFTDEHPDSIDDTVFYTAPSPFPYFVEIPGNQHDSAAGITFADGHVEMHKWSGSVLPFQPVKYSVFQQVPISVTDPDMLWLAAHTPHSP